jgi:hypothetical protein
VPLLILIPTLGLVTVILLCARRALPVSLILWAVPIYLTLIIFILNNIYWVRFWVRKDSTWIRCYCLNIGKELKKLEVKALLPRGQAGSNYPKDIPRWKKQQMIQVHLPDVRRVSQNSDLIGSVDLTLSIKGDPDITWKKVVKIQVPPVEEIITR